MSPEIDVVNCIHMKGLNLLHELSRLPYFQLLAVCIHLQLVTIPLLISWLLFYFASNIDFLYTGLALAGLSGGLMEAPVSIHSYLIVGEVFLSNQL